jgi:DNA gyrase/topoisomerase IV subunit A
VITTEKIEEWIKEVEQRPSSAPLILRYIANRLRDLSERNEELLAENISLRSGERVEEYQRRITSLEYQLNLIRRQFGGELHQIESAAIGEQSPPSAPTTLSLLIYDPLGHVLRMEADPASLTSGQVIAQLDLGSAPNLDRETLRLLPLPSTEEVLFVFTSGRVEPMPLADIRAIALQAAQGVIVNWQKDALPAAIYASEALACLAPVAKMALCEHFLQISRRGYVKKISTSLADSILSNRYIGTGIKQPADQTFELLLCQNEDRLTLVSLEGYVLSVEVSAFPSSIEEAMRLGQGDHLVSAFLSPKDHAALVMTNIAKAIHRTDEFLESAAGYRQRGKGIYSQQRREEGIRVVGAGMVDEQDWGFALHQDGSITLHAISDLLGSGAIQTRDKLLAFSIYSAPQSHK